LGSTETGGVAQRRQDSQRLGLEWTPLKNVEVLKSSEGLLEVKSPFFSEEKVTMGDKLEFTKEGRFLLLGRQDRIVKIDEKRVSLSASETDLRKHTFVNEVVLIEMRQSRQQLWCVVELSRE